MIDDSNNKTVRVKLQKELLESERRELRQKRRSIFLVFLLCVLMLVGGGIIGFLLGSSRVYYPDTISDKMTEIKYYLDKVWIFAEDYEDLDETLNDKALYGMTSFADDPYTTYMSQDELEQFSTSINMDYVGIGVQYTSYNDVPTITRVFKGSPAEAAGLEEGDIFLTIDGKSVEGMSTDDIRNLVIGDEGTPVKFTILRGADEKEITVIRDAIDSSVYAFTENDYVYLDLMSFGETTSRETMRYLDEYTDYSKIIIDLRENTGGYQTSVQEIAGLFLGKNMVVMDQIYSDGTQSTFKTISDRYYDNFKTIVILTSENTASAAEVLTICLKEQHPNTYTVGTTTFGKGIVQSTYMIDGGNSALKITTSKWLSPNGVWIHKKGIVPDYEVFLDDALYATYQTMSDGQTFAYDSVGPQVGSMQLILRYLGYTTDRTDGYFDQVTQDSLKAYQKDMGLEETGVLDELTYNSLISTMLHEYSSNRDHDPQLAKAREILSQN